MQQVPLGRSGLTVSRVILGCGIIGGLGSARATWGRYGLDEPSAATLLDAAVAMGITSLDTANSYAGGLSERVVGGWIATRHAHVVVTTKVGNLVEPDQRGIDLGREHILRQLPRSLERLGRTTIDVYLSHAPDRETPIEETLETFASCVERGWVRSFGACNVDAPTLRAALDAADRLGLPRYACIQNEYNLLAHGDDADVIPLCMERGVAYTPHSPLCGGILSGRYRHGVDPPPDARMAVLRDAYREHLSDDALRAVARFVDEAARRGVPAAVLALAWVLSRTGVTAPVVGPRRPEHLDAVRDALALRLDPDEGDRVAALMRR